MGSRGRQSAASLAVITPTGERLLRCRPEAHEDVRAVFARIVADVGADHFRASDSDLVEQYAASICLAREAYDKLRQEGFYPSIDPPRFHYSFSLTGRKIMEMENPNRGLGTIYTL